MKTLRTLAARLLPLLLLFTLTSCRKAVERAAEKVRFAGIEKVDIQGLTGAEITVRIDNGTAHKLRLEEALATFYYASGRVATLTLVRPAEAPARAESSVVTEWKARIADPLALYAAARALKNNDLSKIAVSIEAKGHGGPAPVNISREMVPLQDFLNTFGVTLDDLKKYIR